MTKKIKTKWVEVPVFSLGQKFTIFSFQYVPKGNRYKKKIKRTIKRGLKNGTKVLLTLAEK
jgi:hypothetical protein